MIGWRSTWFISCSTLAALYRSLWNSRIGTWKLLVPPSVVCSRMSTTGCVDAGDGCVTLQSSCCTRGSVSLLSFSDLCSFSQLKMQQSALD